MQRQHSVNILKSVVCPDVVRLLPSLLLLLFQFVLRLSFMVIGVLFLSAVVMLLALNCLFVC